MAQTEEWQPDPSIHPVKDWPPLGEAEPAKRRRGGQLSQQPGRQAFLPQSVLGTCFGSPPPQRMLDQRWHGHGA